MPATYGEGGARICMILPALDRPGRAAMTRTAVPRDPPNYLKADTLMRHGTAGLKGSTSPHGWQLEGALGVLLRGVCGESGAPTALGNARGTQQWSCL
jgi:hypothetical protein